MPTPEGQPQSVEFETITPENFEAASQELSRRVWNGEYATALPLADKILAYRTEIGEREAALIPYATTYYSAATHFLGKADQFAEQKRRSKEKWNFNDSLQFTSNALTGARHLYTALRTMHERVSIEKQKQSETHKDSTSYVQGFTPDQLDVIQSVYGTSAALAHRVTRGRLKFLHKPWDTIALQAVHAGLDKIQIAKKEGGSPEPHTEILLHYGAVKAEMRQGNTENATAHAQHMLKLGEHYPWPALGTEVPEDPALLTAYGQASRVARKLAEAAAAVGDTHHAEKYAELAAAYAALAPDQKTKLSNNIVS